MLMNAAGAADEAKSEEELEHSSDALSRESNGEEVNDQPELLGRRWRKAREPDELRIRLRIDPLSAATSELAPSQIPASREPPAMRAKIS